MKLNYVISRDSFLLSIVSGTGFVIFFLVTILIYFSADIGFSILGYFTWLFTSIFQDWEHIASFIKLFVLGTYVFFILLILSLSKNKFELDKFKNSDKLKSIEFLNKTIKFNFFKENNNFTCSYSRIKKLKMTIKPVVGVNKYGPQLGVEEIILTFTTSKDKELVLRHFPMFYLKLIYSIIDYTRSIKDFSYEVIDNNLIIQDEIDDLRMKIHSYINKKVKVLGPTQRDKLAYYSFGFFIVTLFIFICVYAIVRPNDSPYVFFIFIPCLPIILGQIWIDIVLIKDSEKSLLNKYHLENLNFSGKIFA